MKKRNPGIRRSAVGAAALLPLLLSGCVMGAGGGTDAAGQERNPTAVASAKEASARLPPGFDPGKVWSVDESRRVYVADQRDNLVLDVYAAGNTAEQTRDEAASASPSPSAGPSTTPGTAPSDNPDSAAPSEDATASVSSVLIARRVSDGQVAWQSTPLRRIMSEQEPTIRIVTTKDGPYAVVVRVGGVPTNGVARAQQLVVADSFPIAGNGGERTPTRHVEHIVDGRPDEADIAIGDGGVMIAGAAGEDGTASPIVVWDPLSGQLVKQPAGATRRLPECSSDLRCDVGEHPVFPSAAGSVFRERTAEGEAQATLRFGVAGRWNSGSVAPQGRTESTVLAVTATTVVAAWRTDEKQAPLYAVHDLYTGAVIASAECGTGTPDSAQAADQLFTSTSDRDLAIGARWSANGRYLVAGSFAADLSARTAQCFSGDRENRSVSFTSVDDAGNGYAQLLDDDDDVPDYAVVRTQAKKVEALPAGTTVPVAVTAQGSGVFLLGGKDDGEQGQTILVAPPAPAAGP